MLKKIRNAKILVTSLGPILSEEHDHEMTISPDADITAGIPQRARQRSAVGEIMGSPFDANGQPIPIDDYEVMGVDVTGMRKIAADPNRRVLLFCGGNPRKVEALDAALRGDLVSILVSDTETVRQLQARDDAR
jgi:DNA-binding transcriptional regulator LsrR (DeoR family)